MINFQLSKECIWLLKMHPSDISYLHVCIVPSHTFKYVATPENVNSLRFSPKRETQDRGLAGANVCLEVTY